MSCSVNNPKIFSLLSQRRGKKQETGLVILNWIQSIVDNSSVNCCSFNSHSCFEKTNKTVRDTYSKRLCKQEVREFKKNTPTLIKKRPHISFTRFADGENKLWWRITLSNLNEELRTRTLSSSIQGSLQPKAQLRCKSL